jgi:glutathione S-transferase
MSAVDATVFGLPESVYVRIVQLVLEAKGRSRRLVTTDPFAEQGLPEGYRDFHPFGRIPAIEIGNVRLYETDAIVHYLDALWPAPTLMPADALAAARARQIMRVADNYAYRALVWGIYVPLWWRQQQPDEGAVGEARRALDAIEKLVAPAGLSTAPSLAAFYLAAMLAPFDSVAVGSALLDRYDGLRSWWNAFRDTPGMIATRSPHARF